MPPTSTPSTRSDTLPKPAFSLPAHPLAIRLFAWVLLLAISATLAVALSRYGQAWPGGADSSGYIHNSRLLLEGKLQADVRPFGNLPLDSVSQGIYHPIGFTGSPAVEKLSPTYPFGYPFLIALAQLFAGEFGGILLSIVFIGVVTPLLVYLLARELRLDPLWSAVAAAITASSPVFLFMATQPMSDIASTAIATGCILLALKAHRSRVNAAALGMLISLGALARLTNALLLVPVVYLLWSNRTSQNWMAVLISAVPGIAGLLWVNNYLYGSPFASGYGETASLFSRDYFLPTLKHFAYWLTELHTPLLTVAALASLLLLFRRGNRTAVAALWLWAVSYIAFYAFYVYSQQTWWYLRFLLPALPAIVIAACMAYREVFAVALKGRLRGWIETALCIAVGSVVCVGSLAATKGRVFFTDPGNDNYALIDDWLKERAAPEDVFLCFDLSGAVFYHISNPIIRCNQLQPEDWRILQSWARREGANLYAILFFWEIDDRQYLSRFAPGQWTEVEQINQIRILRLEPSDL